MRISSRIIATVAVLALGVAPTALAQSGTNANEPGPGASLPAKAKAYGKYCQGASKKHVAGQKGTPFSQCVTGMAKLAKTPATDPKSACAAAGKKHVAGQKGTPFSQCISAAAKLLGAQHAADDSKPADRTAPTS